MIADEYILKLQDTDSFCTLYKATKKDNKINYTIVNYKKDEFDYNDTEGTKAILKEGREIMKELNHPNIIKLIEVKEDSSSYNYICEFCNDKTINKYLEETSDKQLSEEIVKFIMEQVVSAVKYLHDKKIVHRDIKLDNIYIKYNSEEDLLNKNILNSKIILGGFYVSTHLKKGNSLFDYVCTMNYISPEMKTNLDKYNEKIDIWSLGVCCFVLLYGNYPYNHYDYNEFNGYKNRMKYDLKKPLSKEAISFIDSMLEIDPNKRLNTFELSKHPFINKNISI